jgi:starch synthase
LNLLSVASEVFPLVKTGGLADVAGALPAALAEHGIVTRTLLPCYPSVAAALPDAETVHDYGDLFGGPARLLGASVGALNIFALDAPHLYGRPGGIYGWADDGFRFAALARVAADIGLGALPFFVPDVIHAHDWQTGLTFAYLHYDGRKRPGTVMTIHNLAFQGQFPPELLAPLGLPASAFAMDGVEYYGGIGFLKAGLNFADRITTVSPTYAAEIRTPEFGMSMDGLLRARAAVLVGILNGIDVSVWDPAKDPLIPSRFTSRTIGRRAANKAALQERFGLDQSPATPLIALITRLSWQKGVDVVLEVAPLAAAIGFQLAILGAGDDDLQQAVGAATALQPGRIAAFIGYDEALAHLVQAGADAVLVPSRFEPCGLTQLCALRYGAIPVVARTGGLTDTVIDANPMALGAGVATGVQFGPLNADVLTGALRRTVELYDAPEVWSRMQTNAMRADVSWRDPARRYAALYAEIAA